MTTGLGSARAALCRVDHLDFRTRNVGTNLGDLRELAVLIAEAGILQPFLVEDRGSRGRGLTGHRRLASPAWSRSGRCHACSSSPVPTTWHQPVKWAQSPA